LNAQILAKIERIRLIVSDVDGTLTDGRIFINADGLEAKCYSARDGLAANIWVREGGVFALLTGRSESETVLRRAKEMKVAKVVFGSSDKHRDVLAICSELGVTPEQTIFLGDDLPDIPAMKAVGLSAAVGDAAPEVCEFADVTTVSPGGRGALRELIELVLKQQGKWEKALTRYLD
jgi:3-deoxy-D-manno-octulosonate 8-phosphate phosphatase (KDO 8-P phosphatase)